MERIIQNGRQEIAEVIFVNNKDSDFIFSLCDPSDPIMYQSLATETQADVANCCMFAFFSFN